jgi:ribosomal-protein-alanine N-acetyltransferase
VEIETTRLLLREMEPEDLSLFHGYRNDDQYLEHYPYDRLEIEDTKELLDKFIYWSGEVPRAKYQVTVTLKASAEFIGCCGIRCERAGDTQGEIGFEISPEHWGNGYAGEAAGEILKFAFEKLKLSKVIGRCVVANRRSVRVLKRLGFEEAKRIPAGAMDHGSVWAERVEMVKEVERGRLKSVQS